MGVGVCLVSVTAHADSVEGEALPCQRWKAVLLDLSPLGVRIHLPRSWPLNSFCCESKAVTIEELELALVLSGESGIDTFRARAAQLAASELDARCTIIHETLEAIRHATH